MTQFKALPQVCLIASPLAYRTLCTLIADFIIIKKILNVLYRVIQKDELKFVNLYFLNYTWYVNDPHNI